MPFIPHTEKDVAHMLQTLGLKTIDDLFDEIPANLLDADLANIPAGLSERAVTRLLQERAPATVLGGHFLGAGAYEHHIPAAVWDIVGRGEFLTAYTPYQAEASQGTLQVIYEYQTMIAGLMGMAVSNASLYDGASALVEATLMALRLKKSMAKRVLVPRTLHPAYRQVLQTILEKHDVFLEDIPFCQKTGAVDPDFLKTIDATHIAALIIPQPNFFGVLESVDALTDFAHAHDALVIAVVNPTAMALYKEPGAWGKQGADIVCGEGQPLGVPLASGGPYFGFMCCRQRFIRQLPGRIVGRTHDANGREGFTLTLQTREQHIRRAKATSNICTNQGLLVTAATIYMSLLGPHGLRDVAMVSHQQTQQLVEWLTSISGVERLFEGAYFHECALRLPAPVNQVLAHLSMLGIQGGYSLKAVYPELGEGLLVCATDTKTKADLMRYQQCLAQCLLTGKNVS